MIEMKPPPLHWQVRAAQEDGRPLGGGGPRQSTRGGGALELVESLGFSVEQAEGVGCRRALFRAFGFYQYQMYQRCWVSWDKALLKVLRPCRLNTDFKNVTDLRNTKDFFPKPYTYIHVLPTSALYLLSFSMLLVGVGLKASVRASQP